MQNRKRLAIEWWAPSRITPYEGNPRVIPDFAVDQVAASIKTFGWRQPIVVDAEGVIIVGHTRREAAIKLKLRSAPVTIAKDLTPDQVKAYRLADNKVGEASSWDFAKLDFELASFEFDLGPFGLATGAKDFDPVPREAVKRLDHDDAERCPTCGQIKR